MVVAWVVGVVVGIVVVVIMEVDVGSFVVVCSKPEKKFCLNILKFVRNNISLKPFLTFKLFLFSDLLNKLAV